MSTPTIVVVQWVRVLSILSCYCLAIMHFAEGWSLPEPLSRRHALGWMTGTTVSSAASILLAPVANALADDDKLPDRFDVDNFIKTGMVAQPMGVSGQAGKSRPETGVVLRDGSEVNRDARTGDVLAEILLSSRNNPSSEKVPVLASFQSPWPLATGTVFDVECRDANTGDGAFLAVTTDTKGVALQDLSDSFFINQLMAPTSRFSFYGSPTDIKVRKNTGSDPSIAANYRLIDLSFSTLSQSTQTEIPRRACIIATIPEGTSQAVMLVGSTSALRWKKGANQDMAKVIRSFRAIPAPKTSLKVRAKERRIS